MAVFMAEEEAELEAGQSSVGLLALLLYVLNLGPHSCALALCGIGCRFFRSL